MRLCVAVLAILLVATACADRPAQPVRSDSPAGLERFYTQQLDWQSCEKFDSSDPLGADLRCARVTVPLDYDKPDGTTITLAISRAKATGNKIGSVLFNPGGPGAPGLSMADAQRGAVSERFDQIGWDPRGVGASEPAVRCLDDKRADARRQDLDIDFSPPGIAQTEREEQEYVAACAARMTPEFLAHIGTRETVRDMDVIRAVLGDPKLTYVGYSYGTRLGAAYAETFPDRVRALVLDGAVDPDELPMEDLVGQAKGFQVSFDAFAAECAKAPSCPLGPEPAQAVAVFRGLVDPLIAKPATTADPRGLSYPDAATGTRMGLYTPSLWRLLTAGLTELRQGRGDTLLRMADMYEGRRADGTYAAVGDAFNAVRCVDDPRVTDRALVSGQDAELRRAAPFMDDGRATGQAPLDTCAFWPVPTTFVPHRISPQGLPKTVVVAARHDPATPYEDGVDLATQLGAALVSFDGTQHTVTFEGVPCVDNAVSRYLIDLDAPADLDCA